MGGQAWTEEQDKKLRDLYLAETPWPEIEKAMGRSEHACRCRIYNKMPNVPRRGGQNTKGRKRIDWTKEEDRKLIKLRNKGCSILQISIEINRTEWAIQGRLRALRYMRKGKNKKEMRTCLRCHQPFPSEGPGNRICSPCTTTNSSIARNHYALHM